MHVVESQELIKTTIVRPIVGLVASFNLAIFAFLMYEIWVPPKASLSVQTFAVVNSMATAVVIGSGLAWYKHEAAWRVRLVMLGLIVVGAFVGGWVGYEHWIEPGIEKLKSQYAFGIIPDGAGKIRVPTFAGIQASLGPGFSGVALCVRHQSDHIFPVHSLVAARVTPNPGLAQNRIGCSWPKLLVS